MSALEHFTTVLQPYLDQPITELCINRPGEVFIEGAKGWERIKDPAITFDWCTQFASLLANHASQGLTEERNLLSAPLPRGERCQIVMPPSCERDTVAITIRKPSTVIKTLENYHEDGAFDACSDVSEDLSPIEKELLALRDAKQWKEFLSLAVRSKQNVVVSGATGSGKTTFTRAIIDYIPKDERLITIEDTHELPLPNHPNHVHLFYAKDGQGVSKTTPKMLLESCLRMYPSRVLLAELRSDEAYYYLRNVGSGHPGSITTVHANSPLLAFQQLTLLIKESEAGRGMERSDIQSLLFMLVDVIVQFGKVNGRRQMTGVYYDPMRKRQQIAL